MKLKINKRFVKLIICFVLLFSLIFVCIKLLSKGYTNKYTLDDGKFNIKEIYTEDEKNEVDNYYIEVKVNNVIFNYQLYKKKSSYSKIVKDVLYYDGDYKCLLPIFKDDTKVDFLCYKDEEYYNYSIIKGKDKKLDNYINSLSKSNYNINDFSDTLENEKKVNKVSYYNNQLLDKYIISMTDLNGVLSIDNKIDYIEIFSQDIYSRPISTYVNNYYITANYSKKQRFTEFYVVDLIKEKEKIIKTPNYISFDSYIQGVVDNEIYFYDIDNEKQYKINLEDSNVIEIGNKNSNINYYDNGVWKKISTIKAKKIELFNYVDNSEFKEYNYVIKNGNKLSGFYYLAKSTDKGYDFYKVNVQNKKIVKHIFHTDDINISYIDDMILFKDNDSLKIYKEEFGIKTVIKYSELNYNENIKYYIFKK